MDRNNIVIKIILITLALIIMGWLCLKDGAGSSDREYVRYDGCDIAVLHEGDEVMLFLPEYIADSKVRLSNGVKKLDPKIVKYSGVPTIFIETTHGNMDEVYSDKEYKEPGKISAYSENGEKEYSGGLEYIKGRGNYSWASEEWTKKPFTICLKSEEALLGQPKGTKFALIANASDDTLVRNDLARRIQEELGVKYASRGTFTGLYIDGEFQGIYYLCATPDLADERIDIGIAGADITGGYLMEREIADRYKLEKDDIACSFITDSGEIFVVSAPQYATDEQVEYLRDYMNRAESAIMSPEGIEGENVGYADYIDTESFTMTCLTEEIVKNYDAGVSSAFYYKRSDAEGGELCCAPGWDYDMSLGSYQEWMEYDSPEGMTKLYPHKDASPWYARLYDREEFYGSLKQMYRDNRVKIADILYGEGLDDVRDSLDGVYKAEYLRWKTMYDNRGSKPGSDEAYDTLKNFAERRMNYLDAVWSTE